MRNDVEEILDGENPQEKKKRGRAEEDKEGNHCKKKKSFSNQSATKPDTTEHCHNSDINCSISSENPVASGVFDFPWMREGIVPKSEDWDCVEDTFSSLLDDTCFRSRVKFSEYYYWLSDTSPAPAAALMHNFDEDNKYELNESDDDQNADCIWSSLLNQPLQHG